MKLLTTFLAATMLASAAEATPITTPPPPLTALGGKVTAVYVFANAKDASFLSLAPSTTAIFCNSATIGCLTPSTAGQSANLGNLSGVLDFSLHNTSSGFTYDTMTPDANGNYHAVITSNYADFGVGALPTAAAATLASLPNITFIGFEDRQRISHSDWDYNDLVFAISTAPNRNPGVPEPLTISLLGAGLLGAFGLRRKKRVA